MSLKILLMSNAPFVYSGYGQTAYYLIKIFQKLHHEVACFAYFGAEAKVKWEGIDIYPRAASGDPYGNDIADAHAAQFGADIVITNVDLWVLHGFGHKQFNWVPLAPIAEDPLHVGNRNSLPGALKIIAISAYGKQTLNDAGFPAEHIYLPVPTDFFHPLNKEACKGAFGWSTNDYIIGHVGMNRGYRKGHDLLLQAFRLFLSEHHNSLLYMHTAEVSRDGLNLRQAANNLGIGQKVVFPSTYEADQGWPPMKMKGLYNAFDLYVQPSLNEGQAMPVWEAASCFPPYVLVDTDRGFIPISEVKAGDEVLDHEGNRKQVVKIMHREYSGDMVSLQIYGEQYGPITSTVNHPWLIRRGNKDTFIKAEDVRVGDMVILPKEKTIRPLHKYDIDRYYAKSGSNQFGAKFDHPRTRKLGEVELTPDFMRFCGMWVAEGSSNKGTIQFAFHTKEREFHSLVCNVFKSLGLLKPRVRTTNNSTRVSAESRTLERFLWDNFGRGAYNKHIPLWVKQLPSDLLIPFLCGIWEGDGCFYIDREIYMRATYSTVSERLAYDVRSCLLRLGIYAIVDFRERDRKPGKTVRTKGVVSIYNLRVGGQQVNWLSELFNKNFYFANGNPGKANKFYYFDTDNCYAMVQKVTKERVAKEKIYNLNVEDSSSFCVYGFAVHNSGVPIVATNATAIAEAIEGMDAIPVETTNKVLLHNDAWGYEISVKDLANAMLEAYRKWGKGYVSAKSRQCAIENVSVDVIGQRWQDELINIEKIVRFQPTIKIWKDKPHVVQLSTRIHNCGIGAYTRALMAAMDGSTTQECVDIMSLGSVSQIPECDLVHLHYESAISPPEAVLREVLSAVQMRGTPVVATYHTVAPEIANFHITNNLVNMAIIHWPPPGLQIDKRVWVLGTMGCPSYSPPPIAKKEEIRENYGFSMKDIVISTFGFAAVGRGHFEVLEQLAPMLQSDRRVKMQLIIPANFLNEGGKNIAHSRIKEIAESYRIGQQVHLVPEFVSDLEVLNRLWLSDVGFLFIGFHTGSASAAIRFFISARLPAVITSSSHFIDVRRGVVKVEGFNLSEFSRMVWDTAFDQQTQVRLKREHQLTYESSIWSVFAEQYLAAYKKVLGG